MPAHAQLAAAYCTLDTPACSASKSAWLLLREFCCCAACGDGATATAKDLLAVLHSQLDRIWDATGNQRLYVLIAQQLNKVFWLVRMCDHEGDHRHKAVCISKHRPCLLFAFA
jgi:hypothetical protein